MAVAMPEAPVLFGGQMNPEPQWSPAELAEFERLTDEIESSDEAIRKRARIELSDFIRTRTKGILAALIPAIAPDRSIDGS